MCQQYLLKQFNKTNYEQMNNRILKFSHFNYFTLKTEQISKPNQQNRVRNTVHRIPSKKKSELNNLYHN